MILVDVFFKGLMPYALSNNDFTGVTWLRGWV